MKRYLRICQEGALEGDRKARGKDTLLPACFLLLEIRVHCTLATSPS